MSEKYTIYPQAQDDIESTTALRLRKVGPVAAKRILDKIYNTITFISENPYAGTWSKIPELKRKGFRAFTVEKNTYVMLYKIENGKVGIYNIVDGRTNYKNRVE